MRHETVRDGGHDVIVEFLRRPPGVGLVPDHGLRGTADLVRHGNISVRGGVLPVQVALPVILPHPLRIHLEPLLVMVEGKPDDDGEVLRQFRQGNLHVDQPDIPVDGRRALHVGHRGYGEHGDIRLRARDDGQGKPKLQGAAGGQFVPGNGKGAGARVRYGPDEGLPGVGAGTGVDDRLEHPVALFVTAVHARILAKEIDVPELDVGYHIREETRFAVDRGALHFSLGDPGLPLLRRHLREGFGQYRPRVIEAVRILRCDELDIPETVEAFQRLLISAFAGQLRPRLPVELRGLGKLAPLLGRSGLDEHQCSRGRGRRIAACATRCQHQREKESSRQKLGPSSPHECAPPIRSSLRTRKKDTANDRGRQVSRRVVSRRVAGADEFCGGWPDRLPCLVSAATGQEELSGLDPPGSPD